MKPLQGLRILDLSSVIFGPLASQILADYGAEVIKIEPPEGDSTRHTGPSKEAGMAAMFLGSNRSKKSVALDLKQADAQEALIALVATADVLMHSMRPQKLAGLGLAPETLRQRFPRLVYASLVGFLPGPYAGKPAYDDVIQGMSGLADLMERQGGEMRYLPTIAADKTCAHVAAHAILAALWQRERTGQGAFVEIPMFESMVGFNLVEHYYGQHFEPPLSAPGYPRVLAPWRRPYRTADGAVAMMPYTNLHWQRFFTEVGAPELARDARFVDIASRTRHIAELLDDGVPPMPALQQAGQRAISRQTERTAITRFTAQALREIWEMQPRLENPRPRQVEALRVQQRFRAAYDFLVLREKAGEDTGDWGAGWTRYQDADPGLQAELLRALESGGKTVASRKPRKRGPRKRKPAGTE